MREFTRKIGKSGRRAKRRQNAFQMARLLSMMILILAASKAFFELLSAILALFK